MSKHNYGWKKQKQDDRDFKFIVPKDTVIPNKVDLRDSGNEPPIYDQGQLGSCTANGIGSEVQFAMKKQGISFKEANQIPSRLFIYYNERVIEGTVDSDSGAEIRDGIKTINQQGVCSENLWPYDISQFTVKPPDQAYSEALLEKSVKYAAVDQNEDSICGCIAMGFPVVLGISVYDSFEADTTLQTGVIPMPDVNSESLLGGHCVQLVGYDKDAKTYILKNSWGTEVGQQGYFTIPFDYIHDPNLASDIWQIDLMSNSTPPAPPQPKKLPWWQRFWKWLFNL